MNREELGFRAVGWSGSMLLRALGASWRVSVVDDEPVRRCRRDNQPFIFAFWHSRILPLAYLHRGEGIVVLVSEHGDGEYITRVIQRLGFRTGRGSSTRGGIRGLRTLLREGRAGRDLGFSPDGPRGPARTCKPGVVVAAQLTGFPIIPLAAGGPGVWRVDSWDRLIIPRPFTSLKIQYGRPLWVSRDASQEDLERARADVEAEIDRVTDAVDGEDVPRPTKAPSSPASG